MADFDAIVVGSGMSGGWAAKELCEKGLKVLVVERGRSIDPASDYTDFESPWERKNLDRINQDELEEHYFNQKAVAYAVHESTKHFWVKDSDHPYETAPGTRYAWLRGYHTGGRSIMWGRHSYRWGPQDFEANKKEGVAIDWPVRYDDIAPWYDYVEKFAGISGSRDGVPHLPDGQFQPPFEMTCPEKDLKSAVEKAFPGRNVLHARVAHLTQPTQEQLDLGRGQCQVRNYCNHGCSFGAYFSSVSATLPAARRTGNLTMVNNAICQGVDYDPETGKATGVRVIDAETGEGRTYTGRIIFLCASAIASSMILLNSKSDANPNGLANSSDQVGRNLMDHVSGGFASGRYPGYMDKYHKGRRPGGIYVPRYGNITEQDKPYKRGFGYQGGATRGGWWADKPGVGQDYKHSHRTPGDWWMTLYSFGEVLPDPNNRVSLHESKTDKWGMPVPYFDCRNSENERVMMVEAAKDARDMLKAGGFTDIRWTKEDEIQLTPPGDRIHEMGTARMGHDPKTSVLNKWNQAHDVPNLFMTDGAFMTSAACQNPSLTYMAFTARAADHAVKLMKEGKI